MARPVVDAWHNEPFGARIAIELKIPDAVPGVTAHSTVTAASTTITDEFVYGNETLLAMVDFLTNNTLLSIGLSPLETLL